MAFRLFSYLRYAMPKAMEDQRSKRFYDLHSSLLSRYLETAPYLEARTPFEVLRADILIQSLLNQRRIEQRAALAKKTGADPGGELESPLPSMRIDGRPIVVPFFSSAINDHYIQSPLDLTELPYRALKTQKSFSSFYKDPFQTYGYRIFDSEFTSLIPLQKSPTGDSMAFLDIDVDTVFIITDQGTLEESIPFFDSEISNPKRLDLVRRISRLIDAYYRFDQEEFVSDLLALELISPDLHRSIQRAREKERKKREKRESRQ